MTDRDDALTPAQRAALAEWAEASVPDGFADRVMDAWDRGAVPESVAVPLRCRRGQLRHAVVATVAVAAAIAALWVSLPRPGDASVHDAAEAVRPVLLAHCAPCHDASTEGAEAAALDVFDLRRDQWWSSLSQQQLQALLDRTETSGISDGERELVARFVAVQRRG